MIGSSPASSLRNACQVAMLLVIAVPLVASAAVTCAVSATGPSFGIYNPLSATPTYANGQVTATCTLLSGNATSVSLVSSYSSGASGSFALRSMVSGVNTLGYNLYYDAAYSQIRGNGTGGSQTGGATLNLTPGAPTQSVNAVIYGRIPAGQDPAPGSYLDTIVVTITY